MKKNLFKISVAFLAIILAGCLDDEKYALDPTNTNNVIEFYDMSVPVNPAGAIYPVWTNTTEIVPTTTFEQTIRYSGPNGNSSDINLTLAVDPTALAEYNQQMVNDLHGATYSLIPDSLYTFSDFDVTIPAGQKTASISFTVFADKFDLNYTYVLPIRITSSSRGILSANFGVALLSVVIKNKFDGVYEIMGGSITRNSATGPDLALGGDYEEDLEVEFATINATTCGWEPIWKDGSGVAGVGGTNTVVDEGAASADGVVGGKKITTTATGNGLLKNTVGEFNHYLVDNPATADVAQEFTISIDWGTAPSTRIIKGMNLAYTGPRP